MSKIYISDVVCKIVEDYGPCPGAVGVAIRYRKDGEPEKWLTNIEVTGIPNFFLTDEYVMDSFLYAETEEENVEADELSEKYTIKEFNEIVIGEYDELIENIKKCKDGAVAKLMTYILEVTQCVADETDEYIKKGKGKYVSDIRIPDIDTFNHELGRV